MWQNRNLYGVLQKFKNLIHPRCVIDIPQGRLLHGQQLVRTYLFDGLCGNSRIDIPGFTTKVLKYNRPSGHYTSLFHYCMIHHDGTHTNQNIIFDGATVHNGTVADTYPGAYLGSRFAVGAMNNRTVLDIGTVTDPYGVNIPANHGLKPHGASIPQDDISRKGCVGGDEAILTPGWTQSIHRNDEGRLPGGRSRKLAHGDTFETIMYNFGIKDAQQRKDTGS